MNDTAIEIKNLNVSYGNYPVLSDISLEIDKGSFAAVLGPNGSGKTTLIKTIIGVLKPERGSVYIFGKPVKKVSSDIFGYVPQIKNMVRSFPAKAVELVASGLKKKWPLFLSDSDKKKAIEALEKIGAEHLADRQISKLSGGEMQRVYLARSIVREPKILLLDEPSGGIDVVCETNINELIENYNKNSNTTVIMVTHNWATAKHHAAKVILLNKTLIAYGDSKKILTEENLRQAFRHIENLRDIKNGEFSDA